MKPITRKHPATETGTKILPLGYSQVRPTCASAQEYNPSLMQESFVVGVLQGLGKLRVVRDGVAPDQLAEIRAVLFELQKKQALPAH